MKVTHAAAATHNRDMHSDTVTGTTASSGECRKRREIAATVEGDSFEFWPLVTETGGLHGKAARKMVSEMRDRAASSSVVSKAAFVQSAYQCISMASLRAKPLRNCQATLD